MLALESALFDTAIGCCGIVWNARGVAGVQLPEASGAATRARVLRRFRTAQEATPPAEVKYAMNGVAAKRAT
jgi:methylated-DNA-[protein]-cysteine S-methyltransferase